MSLPPSSTSTQISSTTVTAPAAPAMSHDARTLSGYAHLPMLTKDNYMKWKTALKAYLTPYNHVRVFMRTVGTGGVSVDPLAPIYC